MKTRTKKPSKKTSAPTQPATPGSPTVDATALLQLANDPTLTVPGWSNRRSLATCELCHEEHQSPLAYAARLLRRGNPSPTEIAWLERHLAGIVVAPAEPVEA